MSSASLVRNCDCVMLIVANRSGSDVAPRGIQTTRSHSIPRSLIPGWSKSFRKGLADQAHSHRRHCRVQPVADPFVLFHIGSFFVVARPTCFLFFASRLQGAVAGVTNSKDEFSWIVLCNVRDRKS